jgi:hypothetical protein
VGECVRCGSVDLEMVEMDGEGEGEEIVVDDNNDDDDDDDDDDEATLIHAASSRRRGGGGGRGHGTSTNPIMGAAAPARFEYML